MANPFKKIISNGQNQTIEENPNTIKEVNSNSEGIGNNEAENIENVANSTFKVVGTNLPEKTGFWTKLKNALFYEIKIELTPHQQKIEREINDFLHQEITWKSLKEAALSEVPITFRGKRIF